MKTVVDLMTKDGKTEKRINPEFRQFVKDMGTTIKTCKSRVPKPSGKVESPNRFATWLIPYNYEFEKSFFSCSIINNFSNIINNIY